MSKWEVINGDCLDVMRGMPDCSIDSIVTDPPYGLSFMGKKWDYDVPSASIWAEALRVLKPGGHLLSFGGSRTYHRMAIAVEDAGFEIRDQIMWVYGSGFPKSQNVSKALDKMTMAKEAKQWDGWGSALKPAHEPIILARKPLDGTIAGNVLKHGVGGINIDGCRVGVDGGSTQPSGMDRINASLAEQGYRPDAYEKGVPPAPLPAGRFPANLIHDGSDEVVELFPSSSSTGGQASLGAFRNGDVYGKGIDVREKRNPGMGDKGSNSRFFYCAKASKSDRGDGNNHPTVKPTSLMRYLVKLITPPNGMVLDPFTGSGSTGKAAILEGFNFVGIEREAEYTGIAKARITDAEVKKNSKVVDSQIDLFGSAA